MKNEDNSDKATPRLDNWSTQNSMSNAVDITTQKRELFELNVECYTMTLGLSQDIQCHARYTNSSHNLQITKTYTCSRAVILRTEVSKGILTVIKEVLNLPFWPLQRPELLLP